MEQTTTTPESDTRSGRYVYQSPVYKRTLLRQITRDEEVEIGREIADRNADIDKLLIEEASLADAKSRVKKRIEGLQSETRDLSRDVKRGQLEDDVDCKSYHDAGRLAVVVMRLDTFEIVEDRPMTSEEREAALHPTIPGVPLSPAAAAAPAEPELEDLEVVGADDTAAAKQMPEHIESPANFAPEISIGGETDPEPNSPEDLGYRAPPPDRETSEALLNGTPPKNGRKNGRSKRR